jgi:hypothetical protein
MLWHNFNLQNFPQKWQNWPETYALTWQQCLFFKQSNLSKTKNYVVKISDWKISTSLFGSAKFGHSEFIHVCIL